jgi:hypothetical protein
MSIPYLISLRVLVAPGAESARTLAMWLTAQWVRTEVGAEGDVTPLAPLQDTAVRVCPPVETHGAWSKGQNGRHPGHRIYLHRFPPVL